MSRSASSTRQVHTILGGGTRYETVELLLSAIPNFELKQKGRILQLFAEMRCYVFMQEIQEALDERQNNLDSLLAHEQTDVPAAEPFAFESQINHDTYPVDLSSKSTDDSFQSTNVSNETVPLLPVPGERQQPEVPSHHPAKPSWISMKDRVNIKKEFVTPPKTKRRQSKAPSTAKQTSTPSVPSLRQMTMTQLFDPVESPKSTRDSTPIKNEPETPRNDTLMFMPESLIGLAQPSDSMHSDLNNDDEDEPLNGFHSASPMNEPEPIPRQSFKRKSIPSPSITERRSTMTDDEENVQNNAILQTPYSGIESEELLYACPMCRNYWLGLPAELRHKQGLTCRHRQRPVARTPEHFWSLGIPSTQTCIERGYGGVLPPDKPIERPRRPRRQIQRRLQEQQPRHGEDSDTD